MTEEIPKPLQLKNHKPRNKVPPKESTKTRWKHLEAIEAAEAKRPGAPTKFQMRDIRLIQHLIKEAWTDVSIVKELNSFREEKDQFTLETFHNWKRTWPQFFDIVNQSQAVDVKRAYNSLMKLIDGHSIKEDKPLMVLDGGGTSHIETVKIEKEVSPNFNAVKFLLTNLDSDRFSDKKILEMPDLSNLSDEDLRLELSKAKQVTDESEPLKEITGESE